MLLILPLGLYGYLLEKCYKGVSFLAQRCDISNGEWHFAVMFGIISVVKWSNTVQNLLSRYMVNKTNNEVTLLTYSEINQ